MSVWFVLNLGDAMLAGDRLDRIRTQFQTEYERAGGPAEMALFSRHQSEGRLHCEVVLYFTPASAQVALASEAAPCTEPAREGLSLLAGSEEAWSAFSCTGGTPHPGLSRDS